MFGALLTLINFLLFECPRRALVALERLPNYFFNHKILALTLVIDVKLVYTTGLSELNAIPFKLVHFVPWEARTFFSVNIPVRGDLIASTTESKIIKLVTLLADTTICDEISD